MRNNISKGLRLIVVLFCLLLFAVPIAASAQSGSGGSTEVIAHIEAPSTQAQPATQPPSAPVQPAPASDEPVQTGESVVTIVLFLALAGGALALYYLYTAKE